jgi:hypothetical protein
MSRIPTHYEVAEQLVGETDAWLIRVSKEFANGQGIFYDDVDASEIAANMNREQRRRFEAANL